MNVKGSDSIDVTNLSNVLAVNDIVCEASGKFINIQDSAEKRFKSLTVYGMSEQFTTTGAQLLDVDILPTCISSGMTFTNNGNGTRTINGTSNNTVYSVDREINLELKAGNYIFDVECVSGDITGVEFNVRRRYADSGIHYDGPKRLFEVNGEEEEVAFYIQVRPGCTVANAIVRIMLNKGDSVLPWEPYTGGIPSPNPDYPQEIVSVGDSGSIDINCSNPNLLQPMLFENYVTNGVLIKYEKDGRVTFNGTITANYAVGRRYSIINLPAGSYYCTIDFPDKKYGMTIKNKDASITYATCFGSEIKKFTLDKQTMVYVAIQAGAYIGDGSETLSAAFYPVIAPDVEASNIVVPPMYNTATLTTGLPLCRVEKQYVTKEFEDILIVFADGRGEIIKNTELVNAKDYKWVMDWNDTFPDSSGQTTVFRLFVSNIVHSVIPKGYSTHFVHGDISKPSSVNTFSTGHGGGCLAIRVLSSLASNLEEWANFINENDVFFLVGLNKPITIPLTAEEVQSLLKLHTYKPVTNIYNSENAHQVVEYVADTKTYIDNKFNELATALVASQS